MGYDSERRERRKQLRRVYAVMLVVVLCMLIGFAVFSGFVPPETWKYAFALPNIEKRFDGEMRVHFLSFSSGEAEIIELPDGKIVLVDSAGETEADKTYLMRYLNALKVKKIDTAIITNALDSKCGAMDKVLKYKTVKELYRPALSAKNVSSNAYARVLYGLSKSKTDEKLSYIGDILSNENYGMSLLYPDADNENSSYRTVASGEYTANDLKNCSAVISFTYLGKTVLLCSDVTKEVESSLILSDGFGVYDTLSSGLKADVVKLANGGRKSV